MVRSLADRTFQLRSKLSDNSDDDELGDPAEGDDEYQPKLSSDHIAFILSGQAQFPPFKAIAYKSKLEDFVKKCSPTFREKLDKLVDQALEENNANVASIQKRAKLLW